MATKPRIMLDAGHTGKTYNRGTVKGYYESAAMWDLTQLQAEELRARGFEVGTTRATIDTEMEVTARGKKAKGYDLFLSNHTNACDDPSVRRVACIYQTDDTAGTWDTTSKAVADLLGAAIANTMGVTYKNYSRQAGGDRDGDGKKDDNYYGVLHGARQVKVPGIILEHSFHTNVETCKWLMDKDNLRKLAAAEADALAAFYGLDVKPEAPAAAADPKPEGYQVRVKVTDLYIRQGPGTNYKKQGFIEPGKYTIVEEATGKGAKLWGRLKSGAGWIALDYTEKVEAPAAFQSYGATVTPSNGLNVRTGPGTGHKILGALSQGTKITILEEANGWGRITYKGQEGWCSLTYTRKI